MALALNIPGTQARSQLSSQSWATLSHTRWLLPPHSSICTSQWEQNDHSPSRYTQDEGMGNVLQANFTQKGGRRWFGKPLNSFLHSSEVVCLPFSPITVQNTTLLSSTFLLLLVMISPPLWDTKTESLSLIFFPKVFRSMRSGFNYQPWEELITLA